MAHKLTDEEENEYIKGQMAEGLIIIYKDPSTSTKLKERILNELFERITNLESLVIRL